MARMLDIGPSRTRTTDRENVVGIYFTAAWRSM
jgi:hypothetical protein